MAMAIAALLGEWLCVRRELQDIPLGEAQCNKSAVQSTVPALKSCPLQLGDTQHLAASCASMAAAVELQA